MQIVELREGPQHARVTRVHRSEHLGEQEAGKVPELAKDIAEGGVTAAEHLGGALRVRICRATAAMSRRQPERLDPPGDGAGEPIAAHLCPKQHRHKHASWAHHGKGRVGR